MTVHEITPADLDRRLHAEKLAEGLSEFPTRCPSWCIDSHLAAHRLPDSVTDLERWHERRFGDHVVVQAREQLTRSGQLDQWAAEVEALDGASASDLRDLAEHLRGAAAFLEQHA